MNLNQLKRLIQFSIIGASGTLINIAVFNLLMRHPVNAHIPLIANSIAFLIALSNNFYWNFRWTFKSMAKHKSIHKKYLQYFGIGLCVLAINNTIFHTLISHYHVAPRVANILAIALCFMINYLANSWITFYQKKQ